MGRLRRLPLERPDQLERRLRERLDALGPAPPAELLLHVLTLPDFERADVIGDFWGYPESRAFAELLIDRGGSDAEGGARGDVAGAPPVTARTRWPTGRQIGEHLLARSEEGAVALFERHLVLRVAAVASAASLLVLGLQTPASAASPTISSFSPTSGPAGCVVVITGTNFKDPMVTSVDIGGTPVSAFRVVSGKEIWATVAGDASGTIHVTNASATASSPTDFTNANPGGCSPTITFFTPCGGPAGTVVTIIGTNLLKSSGTATTAPVGGDVRFAPYTDTATHTRTPETPRQLSVAVPASAADGRIRVSTFNDTVGEGAVLGEGFIVPPPDFDCIGPETPRSVTLHVVRSLVARGVVSADNGFTACAAGVPVKIQRRIAGEWKTVRTTTTSPTGSYKRRIPDKAGRYRAKARKIFLSYGFIPPSCLRAISPTVRTRS
jgi:IPT/TIG domain